MPSAPLSSSISASSCCQMTRAACTPSAAILLGISRRRAGSGVGSDFRAVATGPSGPRTSARAVACLSKADRFSLEELPVTTSMATGIAATDCRCSHSVIIFRTTLCSSFAGELMRACAASAARVSSSSTRTPSFG
eukprot:scaffold22482_cov69-Phaeocystis_antarctica.AAC.2